MKLYVRLEPPFQWVRTSGKGVDAFGEVPSMEDFPLSEEDELIGVVPSEWVTAHQVTLPTKNRKQFQAAVPFALEDLVSDEVEDLHFSCSNWSAGSPSTVHVISRSKMKEWQDSANEFALPLDRLVPEYSLVPFHDAADCTISRLETSDNQQILAHSKDGGGATVDDDLIDVWLLEMPMTSVIAVTDEALAKDLIAKNSDRDFRFWQAGSKMAHWLEYEPEHQIDLMGDRYRPSVRRVNWIEFRYPLILIAAAAMLVLSYQTFRYFSMHSEIRRIGTQMQEIVGRTLPELSSVETGKERYMMEQILLRRGGPNQTVGVPEMLAEVAFIMKRHRVSMNELVFRDGELVITCVLKDLSQVDAIRNQLNARPSISAALESSSTEDGLLVASYIISGSL